MRYFLMILIVVPAAEIGILMFSGKTIGLIPTIAMIILTGVIGAALAKKQGMETLNKVRYNLGRGVMPGEEVLDGICILVGGTLLLTPGFLTDIMGFFLLAPPTRRLFKPLLQRTFRRWMNRNTIIIR
ncbi:FxsA family protein [Mesobacillus zeae]|uniref:Membrane protein FxsA n=1 Tax=Mesobacillus zeae TaxID=1917180 RepID=A0A398B023_9BACI|nr:FxsA family protein [Mesobacillus zeae]RID83165.1 membrane protein FxsA [Mesobacillus zeae]